MMWAKKDEECPLKLIHVKDCDQEKMSCIASSETTCVTVLWYLCTRRPK